MINKRDVNMAIERIEPGLRWSDPERQRLKTVILMLIGQGRLLREQLPTLTRKELSVMARAAYVDAFHCEAPESMEIPTP